jgi:nucleoside-diphosphate-sugar epimerase
MKCLVLGSEGQIGKELVSYLREHGDEVIEWDFPEGDLCFPSTELDYAVQEADMVYFLAFDVGGSLYLQKFEKTKKFLDNNLALMWNVFGVLENYGTPFIFASSQMSNMSYSPYGVLKRLGEFYTDSQSNGLSVKFWNVYGQETDPDKTHVITDFLTNAAETGTINMRTDGLEIRQFLHANDCSKCLRELAVNFEHLDRNGSFDITSFEWHSIREVAAIVCDLFPGSKFVPANAYDEVQLDAANEPTEHILKYWKPETNLKDGIEDIARKMGLL